jgi:maleylpyruvate isomerase
VLKIGSIIINVSDMGRAAEFWKTALGYAVQGDSVSENTSTVLRPYGAGGPAVILDGDDRMHLDLHVGSKEQLDSEVERLVQLGARQVDWTYPDGARFVVLADPEGNLFCVVNAGQTSQDYVERCIAGCARSHRRLWATIEHLDDGTARQRSRLPGWTIGHVLTHIARNADSHVRMLTGALRGEHLEQYAGGMGQRARDIEDGADRPARELVEDVRQSAAALESTWAVMSQSAWESYGMGSGRPWPTRHMPAQRWREVEVHHADLGLAYGPDDWPDDWVSEEFAQLAQGPNGRPLLAWVMGRAGVPDVSDLRPWTSSP